jgi:acyl-CoA reductase-like NAD-dependent aldehyde dehydrogenase
LALHASHIKVVRDADDEEMAGRTSRCDEECAANQRILISQRLTKERMTRPLAEARKLRAKLELHVDIMEAYTEATLEKELAQEMACYLDESIGPILEVLRCFDTMVRVAQCKEPL